MEINNFISSGIIELYCMGVANAEETKQVEQFALESKEVRDEIMAVQEALRLFAAASEKIPASTLKNKIMQAITDSGNKESFISDLPPQLSVNSEAGEWIGAAHCVAQGRAEYLLRIPMAVLRRQQQRHRGRQILGGERIPISLHAECKR